MNVSRLLGIAAVGASIAKARLVQRFVNDLANVITLAIVTGFMAGALLIGGFYIAYQGLVHYGLEPFAAQVLIAITGTLAVLILLAMTASYLRRLKTIPGQIIHAEFPLSSRLNGLADSFLDGLFGSSRDRENESL